MPILFKCPHCGNQTNVADEFAGQSGPCAKCGQTITVPLTGESGLPTTGQPMMPPPAAGKGLSTVAIVAICILGTAICCGGISIPLILPAVQAARQAARRTQSVNNMKQIGLAMHNYHDTTGKLPPAFTVDADGKPLHSWRVLILPHLEQQALYSQIRLDEPWDSPHNRQFHSRMPAVYRSPVDPPESNNTDYLVITGPGLIFDGPNAVSLPQISDGSSNTILLVEANARQVNWMKPGDLDIQEVGRGPKNQTGGDGISGKFPGGANVVLADGSVRFLPQAALSNLEEMLTIAGGEPVNPF